MNPESLTSALIIIGNEILSGRTDDKNINFLAKELFALGIRLKEVRIVADTKEDIISAIKETHEKYDYIFTTGGIGPTHDDITAGAVASAFDVPIEYNKGTLDTPKGSFKIFKHKINIIGFRINNVFVLAGVPEIMQQGFTDIKPSLKRGNKIYSKEITLYIKESSVSDILANTQNAFKDVEIGSYPFTEDNKAGVNIVFLSNSEIKIEEALKMLQNDLSNSGKI